MPVMSGTEFRKVQLEDLALASLPTVIMTAMPDLGAQVAGMFANACLATPVQLDELPRFVKHYCDEHIS